MKAIDESRTTHHRQCKKKANGSMKLLGDREDRLGSLSITSMVTVLVDSIHSFRRGNRTAKRGHGSKLGWLALFLSSNSTQNIQSRTRSTPAFQCATKGSLRDETIYPYAGLPIHHSLSFVSAHLSRRRERTATLGPSDQILSARFYSLSLAPFLNFQ